MSRLEITSPTREEMVLDELYKSVIRRITSGVSLLCPVDMAAAFLRVSHAQSCGKCVPCRVGLGILTELVEDVLAGKATMDTLDLIEKTAKSIVDTADCAIGYEGAALVLRGLEGFRDDYISHIKNGKCSVECRQGVPCMSYCPAGVEIPEYVAFVAKGQYADAIRVIRKDNPFPSACGYVCEHPCEAKCRRRIIDDSINIRGLKKYAVDNAGTVPPPKPYGDPTGKKVAIIGAGPAGLTAAYYLTLMGHSVEVFEKRDQLGGMLRYGIPRYRLPEDMLNYDIDNILSTGVKVHTGVEIGKEITFPELREKFDAVYIAIGAHTDKKLKIPGIEGEGVVPAVEMLRDCGSGNYPDFTGKTVCIVGAGNVAMDAARSALRCGAKKVNLVYRRGRGEMPALDAEIDGAVAESVELMLLMSPAAVIRNEDGTVKALQVKPQRLGKIDAGGRPSTIDAKVDPVDIPCDSIILAIGQQIESEHFGENGVPLKWDTIVAGTDSFVTDMPGVFAGGDCVTGPATVIKAVAAGKVAAANIDEYLGFNHIITPEVESPEVGIVDTTPWGRSNAVEREARERVHDFKAVECSMTCEEATREAERCLRCDHYGYGAYWEDRRRKW